MMNTQPCLPSGTVRVVPWWLTRSGETNTTGPSRRVLLTVEVILLVGMMTLVGFIQVPSHWTSVWMDYEFTGWVAPVANRMHDGLILYGEHGHLPMPPGPFVLVEVLTQGQATWWTESCLNFVCQSLALGIVYLTLSLLWRPPIPFLATFAAMAYFYALPKTILYDSSAQFLVALTGFLALLYLRHLTTASKKSDYVRLGLVAGCAALTVLFKQSTGGGLCIGLALAVLTASVLPWKQRLTHAAFLTVATFVCFVLLTLALQPWIDARGMIYDVFLTGAEAKGGGKQLVKNLLTYGYETGQHVAWFGLIAAVVFGVFRCRINATPAETAVPAPQHTEPFPITPWLFYPATVAIPVLVLLTSNWKRFATLCLHADRSALLILWIGLLATLLLACKAWWPDKLPSIRGTHTSRPFAGLVVILGLGAIGHTLSIWWLRWSFDNNPLIVLVLAVMCALMLHGYARSEATPPLRQRLTLLGLCLAMQWLAWSSYAVQYRVCRRCTVTWPEVAYLQGARMTESASGMRQLVAVVKQAAPDRANDRVLLLPNDPNVEAWWDRKNPELSSVILFADQYLDRRVEQDLATLRACPPRLIVIGPKNYWRSFHHNWNQGYGAERFIDALEAHLLPELYELHATVPISHNRKADVMQVFIRKEVRGTNP